MNTKGAPTPQAHGTLRAVDQFVALCLVSHPRCGWSRSSSSSSSSSDGICAVRLVWELVKDTRRSFVIGSNFWRRSVYWLIKFEVSPLVLGILGGDGDGDGDGGNPVIATGAVGAELSAPLLGGWVDDKRWLLQPFVLHDLATGEEVSLYPSVIPPESPTFLLYAVNHVWFVAGGFESDLKEGSMLRLSIGRLADKDPGATPVIIRLGYPAASHKVVWVVFNQSAVNEVVAVVRNRQAPDKHVFVVIDVERSFNSQSLCVLSETRPELGKGWSMWGFTFILMYRAGFRNGGGWLCDIWDCNDMTRPLLRVPREISDPSAVAESGLVFSIEENQLMVVEPLTGFTVLCGTLPSPKDHFIVRPYFP
ncbi:hypothetical protein Pelo_9504 [Pelomyxa schiedti]|nr:hypothetical protein Pelo_9504 [Pelomyxa schiedti]